MKLTLKHKNIISIRSNQKQKYFQRCARTYILGQPHMSTIKAAENSYLYRILLQGEDRKDNILNYNAFNPRVYCFYNKKIKYLSYSDANGNIVVAY